MDFTPIWVSSAKHLEEFSSAIKDTPKWRKLIGTYKLPKGFPKLRIYHFMGVPIVYYSKGEVQVNEKSIKYIAKKNKMGFARSYTGLKDNLEFELEYTKIKQIEWFKPKYALINYYNIKWIKINYEVSTTEEEILICVGSMGPSMGKIINNTDELYKVIMQLWQNI